MRADKFFAEKFGSRTKSAQAIEKGFVLKNGVPLKPSDEVSEGDVFTFLSPKKQFVSNGGYKLDRALSCFHESVLGGIFADFGASTGGFTDCLLQNGAQKVYCVDVGESQLDESIAKDPRIVVMDRTNARSLTKECFQEVLDGIVTDLSFISLTLILPVISQLLENGKGAFVLVKPQFEAGKKLIGKRGIVPRSAHPQVLKNIYRTAISLSLAPVAIVNAPVREKKNVEYIVWLIKDGTPLSEERFISLSRVLWEEKNV